ncbi:MAG: SpoIIE family protein phosphatase [Bacillota bacterium]
MEVSLGVAKIPKSGFRESGDSLETVERPRGGLSVIMADGQGSGRPAKRLSSLVVAKAAALIADGTRDGACARAVHDYLYSMREGKVLSTLVIVSVDLHTRSLIVSRNTASPVLLDDRSKITLLDQEVPSIGVNNMVKPHVTEVPLKEGLLCIGVSDGVANAGRKYGERLDLDELIKLARGLEPYEAAGRMLDRAVRLDRGRPEGDMTVFVVGIGTGDGGLVRRIKITLPI